ncbi:MAG: thioesterase family protein [Sphingobacteriales bacterium]|nr:thioesterase family protein [Sphingobacteriales bacterium]
MARIKLQIPERKLIALKIPIRITDLNYGQHLGNDSLVTILHEARVQWLFSLGYTELDAGGSSLIMGELIVNYLGECFYPDILDIEIFSGDCSRSGFELYYRVATTRQGQQMAIAIAKTSMVCFDYTSRAIVALPIGLKKILHPDKKN